MKKQRVSIHETMMSVAAIMSRRSTCARRRVGCVLVDIDMHVLATGYNGVASGVTHCIDKACPGAKLPSGQGLNLCEAIHAEQNALLQCRDVRDIYTAYCTTAPCVTCTKLLLNTGCMRIIFFKDYPHSEMSSKMWKDAGREWIKYSDA